MIEDLLLWLKTPLGEEMFLMFLLPLISSVLILWGISKLFKLKRNNFLTALLVSGLYVFINFLIRLTNILLGLSDSQKPYINVTASIVSTILLIFLIVTIYKANWWKTFFSWLMVFSGKFVLMSIVMVIMIFSFPTFSEHDSTPTVKAGMGDFYISNIDEVGSTLGENYFAIHQSKIRTPTSILAVNLALNMAFNSRTKGVNIDLECRTPEEILFLSIQNNKIHEWPAGKQYEFESGNKFNFRGYAGLSCDLVCNREKTIFNFENLFDKNKDYITKSTIAETDSGKFIGTKVLHIERRKPLKVIIDFVFEGNESETIHCNVYIITEKPSETIKKSFTIKYIAD